MHGAVVSCVRMHGAVASCVRMHGAMANYVRVKQVASALRSVQYVYCVRTLRMQFFFLLMFVFL